MSDLFLICKRAVKKSSGFEIGEVIRQTAININLHRNDGQIFQFIGKKLFGLEAVAPRVVLFECCNGFPILRRLRLLVSIEYRQKIARAVARPIHVIDLLKIQFYTLWRENTSLNGAYHFAVPERKPSDVDEIAEIRQHSWIADNLAECRNTESRGGGNCSMMRTMVTVGTVPRSDGVRTPRIPIAI